MKRVVVIGGGLVGQLIQLAYPDALVLDNRPTPPENHLETRMGPQYLWEPIDHPRVECKEIQVTTLVDGNEPTPESILAYKQKIGKEKDGGDWGLQFQHQTTGWLPTLPKPRVQYGQGITMVDLPGKTLGLADFTTVEYDILVNTISMPVFLSLLIVGPEADYPFRTDPIYITTIPHTPGRLLDFGMKLNYLSNPEDPCYRITYTADADYYEQLAPMPIARKIHPGKIHPHHASEQILFELIEQECYCFGRFATWRPDELAHQTWQQICSWKGAIL